MSANCISKTSDQQASDQFIPRPHFSVALQKTDFCLRKYQLQPLKANQQKLNLRIPSYMLRSFKNESEKLIAYLEADYSEGSRFNPARR